MIRPRHILHPIRSAESLYGRVSLAVYRHLAEREFRKVRRGHRDRCWCGGNCCRSNGIRVMAYAATVAAM
jgi:hypothetical protein